MQIRTARQRRCAERRPSIPAVEPLEPRSLLSGTPLPTLDQLENPSDPVVRIETTLGTIDIELLVTAAPGTLAHFLSDLGRGFFDFTAFHRSVPGEVLQVGLERSSEPSLDMQLHSAPLMDFSAPLGQDGSPQFTRVVAGDPSRTALQWTVSYTEHVYNFGANASATSLSFNLIDSPTDVLAQPTPPDLRSDSRVIGRVPPDSRPVVAAIAGLPTMDLSGFPYQAAPFRFLLDRFVVQHATGLPNDQAPPASEAVVISDASLIKPQGSSSFFASTAYYPEGFVGATISEFVPIANPNDQDVAYQLVARFEQLGENPREQVIASGTIAAHSRGGVTISRATDHFSLLRDGIGYALELQSTLPLTANLSHYDFGAATGEAFTPQPAIKWSFANGFRPTDLPTTGDRGFLLWQNTTDQDATVRLNFFPEDGSTPVVLTLQTPAHRRGGLELFSTQALPVGRFGILIEADQPIVAALTHYSFPLGPAPASPLAETNQASTELGVPGAGFLEGTLPLAGFGAGATQALDFLNAGGGKGGVDATVTLTFTPLDSDGPGVQHVITVPLHALVRVNLGDLSDVLSAGRYSVTYTADAPVIARGEHVEHNDAAADPFAVQTSSTWRFADGFMPALRAGVDVFETVGIYTPAPLRGAPTPTTVSLTFLFGDGSTLVQTLPMVGGNRLAVDLHTFAPLLAEPQDVAHTFYSLVVSADVPIVAEMWHYDLTLGSDVPAGGFGTLGDPGLAPI